MPIAQTTQVAHTQNLFKRYQSHQTEVVSSLTEIDPLLGLSTERGKRLKREAGFTSNRKPLNFFRWLFKIKSVANDQAPRQHEALTEQRVHEMLTQIHPSLAKATLEVLNLSTLEILKLAGNTAPGQTTNPNKALVKLIGVLIGAMNSRVANKKECLMILSSILTSPHFIDSLTPHQHQEVANSINKSLFRSPQYAELIYKELLAPLLASDTSKTKPYLKLSISGFIRILEKSAYSRDLQIEIRNNLIMNKLINTPTFLASLTSKQHKKLAELFKFKITEPTNAEKYIHDLPVNIEIANFLVKKRETYIIFSGILLINGNFSKVSPKNRLIWLDSMSKAMSNLHESSVCETELDLLKESIQDLKHLNSSQNTFLQLESRLCNRLEFFEKGLVSYQATLPKRSRNIAIKNEKIVLENMKKDLRSCTFETLSQMKSVYS